MISTHPVKTIGFRIRVFKIVDEPMADGRADGITRSGLFALFFQDFLRRPIGVFKIPGAFGSSRIVGMVYHSSTFQHKGFKTLFSKLLGSPAPTDAGSNNDGIISVLLYSVYVPVHFGELCVLNFTKLSESLKLRIC